MLLCCEKLILKVWPVKRTQLQLDDKIYELLRRKAFEENISIASVVRRALESYLTMRRAERPGIETFTFIGSGHSKPAENGPVSERHDEAFAEDFLG